MSTRECIKCKKTLDVSNFNMRNCTNKKGDKYKIYRRECKSCRKAINSKYYKNTHHSLKIYYKKKKEAQELKERLNNKNDHVIQ